MINNIFEDFLIDKSQKTFKKFQIFFRILFSHWIEDITSVIENLTEGHVVIVGASLGGW